MGCVYKAEDLRLPGRLCAIKEVQPELGISAEDRAQLHDQFLTEASILAQLDHPNLPKVSDFFTDDAREYLVMDFVAGEDLKQIIDRNIRKDELLEPRIVMEWAAQILDTLDYLHHRYPPVVHRDIKPANIKLTPEGRIKLVDFGLVKLMGDDERTLTVMQGRGSALYTPLEQYGGDGGQTDARSDLYSFGATLYQLLTSKAPPDAKARFLNPRMLLPPYELNPDVRRTVSDAVLWAMEMHPDDRPANVDALRDVLFGREKRPKRERETPTTLPLFEALAANQVMLLLVLVLLLFAFFVTIL
jgi:serine/threonine-protein kinase